MSKTTRIVGLALLVIMFLVFSAIPVSGLILLVNSNDEPSIEAFGGVTRLERFRRIGVSLYEVPDEALEPILKTIIVERGDTEYGKIGLETPCQQIEAGTIISATTLFRELDKTVEKADCLVMDYYRLEEGSPAKPELCRATLLEKVLEKLSEDKPVFVVTTIQAGYVSRPLPAGVVTLGREQGITVCGDYGPMLVMDPQKAVKTYFRGVDKYAPEVGFGVLNAYNPTVWMGTFHLFVANIGDQKLDVDGFFRDVRLHWMACWIVMLAVMFTLPVLMVALITMRGETPQRIIKL
ncbi:MAG: hypothetical protein DRO11_00055 [Methanobacteriota archaeon]|nr:MAG: hypothetical protein DRO11_00055 [Euryarchaeota archaeon]